MTETPRKTPRHLLGGLAEYLAAQQTTLLEQWLIAVRRDTQIESADRLPQHQLVDHLPRLLMELRAFLRARDADILTSDVRRDAASHGELRWQDGYQIDELLRELEAFRQLVMGLTFRYQELNPDFQGALELNANALIHQFFAEISVASAKQFMREQQNVARACRDDLATAQEELGRAGVRLERALKERQQSSAIIAQELRKLLRQANNSQGVVSSAQELQTFVEQLVEFTELSGGDSQVLREEFDPRALFSEIVTAYKPRIEGKGLRLFTEVLTAPDSVSGDRHKIRRVAGVLLDNAIQNTSQGHISFGFLFPDSARWQINVSDTGPGLSSAAAEKLFSGTTTNSDGSTRGIGLAIAKELIALLGGAMNTESQSGTGMRIEVTLPRAPK